MPEELARFTAPKLPPTTYRKLRSQLKRKIAMSSTSAKILFSDKIFAL